MAFTTDEIGIFFDDDFAEDATYQFSTLRVIFDRDFRIVVAGVESATPAARCKSSDVTTLDLKHNDVLTIGGNLYKIIGIQSTDDGFATLILTNIEN